jgi:hypothetical protein
MAEYLDYRVKIGLKIKVISLKAAIGELTYLELINCKEIILTATIGEYTTL